MSFDDDYPTICNKCNDFMDLKPGSPLVLYCSTCGHEQLDRHAPIYYFACHSIPAYQKVVSTIRPLRELGDENRLLDLDPFMLRLIVVLQHELTLLCYMIEDSPQFQSMTPQQQGDLLLVHDNSWIYSEYPTVDQPPAGSSGEILRASFHNTLQEEIHEQTQ